MSPDVFLILFLVKRLVRCVVACSLAFWFLLYICLMREFKGVLKAYVQDRFARDLVVNTQLLNHDRTIPPPMPLVMQVGVDIE